MTFQLSDEVGISQAKRGGGGMSQAERTAHAKDLRKGRASLTPRMGGV